MWENYLNSLQGYGNKFLDFMKPSYTEGANGAMLQDYKGIDMAKDAMSLWNLYNQNQFNDKKMDMMDDMQSLNNANYANAAKDYNRNLWFMYRNADMINGNDTAMNRYDQDKISEIY